MHTKKLLWVLGGGAEHWLERMRQHLKYLELRNHDG